MELDALVSRGPFAVHKLHVAVLQQNHPSLETGRPLDEEPTVVELDALVSRGPLALDQLQVVVL